MIHHFKPTVTSIMAVALLPENRPDIEGLIDRHLDKTVFQLQPDCSVIVRVDHEAICYGARSDPMTWWMMFDSRHNVWFTTQDPYTDDDLVPSQRAR